MSVVMDYPTAWAFVRGTRAEDHHEKCSWPNTNGAVLCDCAVFWDEYERRKVALNREAGVDLARALGYGPRPKLPHEPPCLGCGGDGLHTVFIEYADLGALGRPPVYDRTQPCPACRGTGRAT